MSNSGEVLNSQGVINDELIVVKQLPVIEQQLQTIKPEVDKQVSAAIKLAEECTEDNYKEIKKIRAEINADFTALEERRKIVKRAINEPYDNFEAVYKKCVAETYEKGLQIIDAKVSYVTDGIKNNKENDVKSFFNEYAKKCGIEFLRFERSGIKVNLSSSVKSLKDKSKEFIDKVIGEIELIEKQEHSDEVRVEYEKTFDLPQSVNIVTERYRAIEQARQRKEEAEKQKIIRDEALKKSKAAIEKAKTENMLEPPVEIPNAEQNTQTSNDDDVVVCARFKVKAPKKLLRLLKNFMDKAGIKYECF